MTADDILPGTSLDLVRKTGRSRPNSGARSGISRSTERRPPRFPAGLAAALPSGTGKRETRLMTCLSRPELLAGSLALGAAGPLPARLRADAAGRSVFMVLWRGETEVEAGFRAHFDEAGVPIDITIRSLDRDVSRLPSVIAEIRRVGPDLVYTWGTSVTLGIAGRDPELAKGPDDFPPMILDRPVLFTMVSQPVRSRIVKAFGPTGRNVAGVSHIVPVETQVRAMTACMPVDRIAVICTPTEPNSALAVEQLASMGQHLAIRIEAFPVLLDSEGNPSREALPELIDRAVDWGPQFLYLGPDSFIGEHAKYITGLANERRLPSFASTERMLAASDAVYGLVAPNRKVGRFTARKAERILCGEEAVSDIPVEVMPEFSYQIRADVAQSLGILPDLSLLD